MQNILNELLSAILQILVFSLIPFIFFLLRKDKSVTFFRFIGLYKPSGKSLLYSLLVTILFILPLIVMMHFDSMRQLLLSPNSVSGKIHNMGLNASSITVLLIIAWLKTSLSEEILFRGFIGKQLVQKLGFQRGNILQAVIFGLVHLLLFAALAGGAIIPVLLIFIFSTFAGWSIGYIKERFANGSIIPGWVAHGFGNTAGYFLTAFVL